MGSEVLFFDHQMEDALLRPALVTRIETGTDAVSALQDFYDRLTIWSSVAKSTDHILCVQDVDAAVGQRVQFPPHSPGRDVIRCGNSQ
ncbi:MAG: hypothetical protein JXB85_04615 [Anaerolineales bacterium]|nr:hypothetical protein [Anaerolineales bacterium]